VGNQLDDGHGWLAMTKADKVLVILLRIVGVGLPLFLWLLSKNAHRRQHSFFLSSSGSCSMLSFERAGQGP
jgi:hypothetical protein